ncbi:MAG TPA: response regulator [Candidatus Paceibacterota bacterium]|nr:response regulator [Candidatus Paceibacterota bacterium]
MSDSNQPLILVVDDEPDIISILSTKLEAAGMRVQSAANGKEAIESAKKEHPDLIVMDVRMPVMSGTEAITKIKEDPALKDTKVVFLSNFGEEEEINAWIDQKYAREMGAVDYLKKSEDLGKIVGKIQQLLNAKG